MIPRRTALTILGLFAGSAGITSTVSPVLAEDQEGIIEIADQTSDGTSVIIDRIETDIDATLGARNSTTDENIVFGIEFEAGAEVTDYELELKPPITESFTIQVSLYDADGSGFVLERAEITIEDAVEVVDEFEPTLIDPDPSAGFNYPYFLYAPSKLAKEDPIPPVVEPTNTGTTDDDLDVHIDAGRGTVDHGISRDVVDDLGGPLIVPVFPRPANEPVDWTHYIHALDRETMQIDDGPLERVDQQLLAMVEDAKQHLDEHGYPVSDDGIILTGFSASGNFVERFVALHPEEVHSASAGGLNGMVTLPIEELRGDPLEYHIGVANLAELTGEAFDRETYRDVPQFLYLGEDDTNDTLPYDDAWTGDFDQVALDVYGQHMQDERFPLCRAVHDAVNTNAIFRMYEDTGHSPRPAIDDVIEFHERVLDGDAVEAIRSDLGGGVPNLFAYIDYSPADPLIGEQVVLDGMLSDPPGGDVVEYSWEINDDQTLDGDVVTYAFDQPGGHHIRLTVTDEGGDTYEAVETITVINDVADLEGQLDEKADTIDNLEDQLGEKNDTIGELEGRLDEKADTIDELEDQLDETSDPNGDRDTSEPDSDSLPGPGILGTVGSLLGAGYALKWWTDNRGSEEE